MLLLLALLAAAAGGIALTKVGVRLTRSARRDPRGVAAACREELAAFLVDQRIEAPRSATLGELGELVEREFGVEARRVRGGGDRCPLRPSRGRGSCFGHGETRAADAARGRAPRPDPPRPAPRPSLASLAQPPGRRGVSESTYSLFQRGRRHLRAGMPAQATVSLEKAKRREPDKASIREALGIAYFRIRRWSEAEAEFRKVLELSPVNDYAHYALGRCLEKQDGRSRRTGTTSSRARSGRSRSSTGRASASSTSVRPMRAVVQRVSRARVSPGGEIGRGLCVLLGVARGDGAEQAVRLAGKVARLRIFPDGEGASTARSWTSAAQASSSRSSR